MQQGSAGIQHYLHKEVQMRLLDGIWRLNQHQCLLQARNVDVRTCSLPSTIGMMGLIAFTPSAAPVYSTSCQRWWRRHGS
jgi:hypothetical protein